jgi:hypothetical protein
MGIAYVVMTIAPAFFVPPPPPGGTLVTEVMSYYAEHRAASATSGDIWERETLMRPPDIAQLLR